MVSVGLPDRNVFDLEFGQIGDEQTDYRRRGVCNVRGRTHSGSVESGRGVGHAAFVDGVCTWKSEWFVHGMGVFVGRSTSCFSAEARMVAAGGRFVDWHRSVESIRCGVTSVVRADAMAPDRPDDGIRASVSVDEAGVHTQLFRSYAVGLPS